MLQLLKQDRQQVTQILSLVEEGLSSNEASLDRTAGANQSSPATEEHTRQSEPTVSVATPAQQTGKLHLNLLLLQSSGNSSGFGKGYR